MSTINCFHGTSVKHADYYLSGNEFVLSECGDPDSANFRDLWLGDGFYLFDDPFHAFKWITQQCFREKDSVFDLDILKKRYKILQIRLNYPVPRTFDLRQAEYRAVFQKILDKISAATIPDIRIPDDKIPDGVVINYIFNKMNYGKNFDLVCAVYILNQENFSETENLKLNFVAQTQYCVKKTHLLVDKNEFQYTDYVDDYIDIWETLFPYAHPIGSSPSARYTLGKGGYYES